MIIAEKPQFIEVPGAFKLRRLQDFSYQVLTDSYKLGDKYIEFSNGLKLNYNDVLQPYNYIVDKIRFDKLYGLIIDFKENDISGDKQS